jgi:hypothetical protein
MRIGVIDLNLNFKATFIGKTIINLNLFSISNF